VARRLGISTKVDQSSEMGRYETGQKKPNGSGRKRGTANRKTSNFQECLQSYGCDLPLKITEILPNLSPDKQADVLLGLLNYIYPKRKNMEVLVEAAEEQEPQVIVNLPAKLCAECEQANGGRRN
jgi:hypothetical protein